MRLLVKTPSRIHISLIDENGEIGRVDGGLGITLNEPNYIIHAAVGKDIENKSLFLKTAEIKKKNKTTDNAVNGQNNDQNNGQDNKPIYFEYLETEVGKILITSKDNFGSTYSDLLKVSSDIIHDFVKKITRQHRVKANPDRLIELNIEDHYSPHLGFGSKTQLSLALGTVITTILGVSLTIEELTALVGRGGTSGIGFRAFETGGFIVDGGHRFGVNREKTTFLPSSASDAKPARTLFRFNFPEDWVILLVSLNVPAGASNTEEVNIFQRYCPIPIEEVRELSHIILMQVLPSIVEKDLETFGKAVERIQTIGFKKIEISLQHDKVKQLIKDQKSWGAPCVGMSSFGPTIYSIFNSVDAAENILKKIKYNYGDLGFSSIITSGNNKGAEIRIQKYS